MIDNERRVSMPVATYNETHNSRARDRCRPALRGIARLEWATHRRTIERLAALWLVAVWILPFAFHPGLVLAIGLLYALALGATMGGSDVLEGSEEFTLALPPTRTERFFTRYALGTLPLVVMMGIGSLAVATDLPQRLWGLVVESGFTEPFPPVKTAWWYGLAVTGPLWLFTLHFTLGSVVRTAAGVLHLRWLTAALVIGGFVGYGIMVESRTPEAGVMRSLTIACLVTTPVLVGLGWWRFGRKEMGEALADETEGHGGGRRAWKTLAIWVVLAIGLLFLARACVTVQTRTVPSRVPANAVESGISTENGR